jgi:branched-subunit amino acid aminotransferase/4-amino-4-deoxychorismate lyase
MVNFLFKKSYQLKTFKPIIYNDLWGKKGIFTTIRIIGNKPKYILLSNHIKNINFSLKKMKIKFLLTEEKIFILIGPLLNKYKVNDNLLRIAINSKIISFSLRPRLKIYKNFNAILTSYKRANPSLKNLYYIKIINLLNKINSQKKEIILLSKGLLLEGCTTNILCIRNSEIYIPKTNYYQGVTMNYLLNETNRIIKKFNISVKKLYLYDEILLVGSGKGVVSLSSISKIKWKRKSNLIYKELLTSYKKLL